MTVHPIHGVGSPARPGTVPTVPGGAAGAHRPTDLVEVSPAAALLRRLDAVLHESPDRFRAVTAGVAGRLGAAATTAEPQRTLLLTRLAERFGAASLAGSPAPLVAEGAAPGTRPPAGAPPGATATTAPATTVPASAGLAAASMAAGAAATRPGRPVGRAAYREKVQRAGGEASGDEGPGGGLLGALLAPVVDVVEAALEAALQEAPPGPDRGDPPAAAP